MIWQQHTYLNPSLETLLRLTTVGRSSSSVDASSGHEIIINDSFWLCGPLSDTDCQTGRFPSHFPGQEACQAQNGRLQTFKQLLALWSHHYLLCCVHGVGSHLNSCSDDDGILHPFDVGVSGVEWSWSELQGALQRGRSLQPHQVFGVHKRPLRVHVPQRNRLRLLVILLRRQGRVFLPPRNSWPEESQAQFRHRAQWDGENGNHADRTVSNNLRPQRQMSIPFRYLRMWFSPLQIPHGWDLSPSEGFGRKVFGPRSVWSVWISDLQRRDLLLRPRSVVRP